MKKLFLFALATAMMAFAGCQNQELEAPNTTNDGSTFELVADILQTKTSLNASTYEVDWEAGDVVYLVTSDGTWGKPYNQDNSAATVAEFTYADGRFTSTASIAAGEYTFKAMYADASQKSYHSGASSTHKLLAAQTQNCANPTAHIKANDALVGTFTATVPVPANEKAAVTMSHLYTLMQVDVKNNTGAAIEVKKFEMTAAGADIAGIFNVVAFDTPAITTKQNASSTITVNLTGGNVAAGESLPVYFVMAPLSKYAGDVTFKVTDSQGKTYTKTVAMNGISFAAGTYNTTPYTLTTPDVVAPSGGSSTWTLVTDALDLAVGDKIVIAALNSNFAMGAASSNGNNRTTVAITKSDNHINITDDVQKITLKSGAKASTFAFDTGSGYLYASSSSSNYLRTKSELDENGSWQIEIAGTGVATIKAQGASTRNWIRFNETNNMFSCYGSGQKDVAIYRLQDSGSVPENYLNVSATAIKVAADATTASFTVSSNLEWTATSDDVQVSINGNLVNVTFEANEEGVEQTYVVTVSANGVDSKTVTITQGAYTDTSDTRLTVAQFNALDDGSTVYELTGVITGFYEKYNSQFNNVAFYINDGTGEVLIYRMSCTGVADPANSITLGDEITVQGTKTTYGGSPQMASGSKYISHRDACQAPEMSFENNTVSITSESGANIYYTTDGSVPSESSSLYNGSIPVDEGQTITVKAIAVKSGLLTSITVTKDFTGVSADAPTTSTISMTFASYTAGTQYANNEAHKINDVLTIYTTKCHFTTELRIYSSSTYNGYVESNMLPGRITQMTFNAGNKADNLVIYGKTDSTSWTKVGTVSVTSTSYKDYTFNFGDTNYTYFKIDVEGSNQIRLKSMSVTYEN